MALSYGVVDYNEIALKKSTYSKSVSADIIYKSGRYFTGVTGTFIKYNSTYQYINFDDDNGDSGAITGKTADASPQQLDLSVVIVYKFKPEFLKSLYNDYPNQNQKADMISGAKDIIYKVIADYETEDFFNDRYTIQNTMGQQIDSYFRDNFYSEVVMFLLKQITLDDDIEQQKINNLVTTQKSLTQAKINAINLKKAQIEVIQNNANNQEALILNEYESSGKEIQSQQESEGQILYYTAQSGAYATIPTTFTQWGASDVNWFLNWLIITQNNNVELYYGVDSTAVVQI
ncbi:hypothetical protein PPERSA_00269 [Pseudocohnilembus persalinus]|uniref:Band 7 domain-containing protein n=1 Tax=Pseudocohnilembus persalinus TaxID=266149 RepID=A0A0V0Q8X6_PSEPJ|nr:hypothetical protein PPERSA_00269 [Pseudocohnilembus persalinus]|eukprot:KRW98681.1 hypothetical protein PPERSA_00269 [Pseudocohnilembus persalinus]